MGACGWHERQLQDYIEQSGGETKVIIEEALQASKEQMDQAPDPVNDILTIDPETRMITVPASEILLGVQHDALAERKYFRCPKIVGDDIDLTNMELYVVYQNAGGSDDRNRDRYHVTDVQAVDDGYIEFSWKLSEKVTSYAGDVQFGVCAIDTDEDGNVVNRWNTGITTGKSMVGLDAGLTDYERESPTDLYTQLITELTQTVSQVVPITVHAMLGSGNVVTSDKSFAEITGLIQDGKNILLRFRTEVQSYTLNLSEVSSSQIAFRLLSVVGKNVQQMDCVFKSDGSIVYASSTLDINSEINASLQAAKDSGVFNGKDGAQGEKGETGPVGPQGPKGTDGKTPVKGVDYYTDADKQEMVEAVLTALPDGTEVSY